MLSSLVKKIQENKSETYLIIGLLVFSGIAHAYNMFHFPYYENDEGTYMSQAWSILRQGKLAPYTYWYDHAPLGWIFISLWILCVNGFFTFGTSIDTGRVFMLVIHVATTLLLYFVARRLTGKKITGVIAIIIFSLSPLAIYFQRRVLLDNIMTFWIFLVISILLSQKLKLSHVILSAVFFGIAVLTKESSIFFIPAFLYFIFERVDKKQRSFALVNWWVVSGLTISFYLLYAILKKEFFPAGFMGSQNAHVSLISTLQFQSSRGNKLPFWDPNSDFYLNLMEWYRRDAFLVVSGVAATVLGLLISIKKKFFRFPTFLAVLFVFFLLRGGLIIDFYFIPLVPIFALLISMTFEFVAEKLSFRQKNIYWGLISAGLVFSVVFLLTYETEQFTKDETSPQRQAVAWIKNNLDKDAFIVMDDSLYVDLHEPGYINDKVFKNAEWSWKVEEDPDIKLGKLAADWRKVDYIVLSHEILRQMRLYDNKFLIRAYENSQEQADWTANSSSHISLPALISTNGDWMSIYKVYDEAEIALHQTWKYYKENFILSYGQVIDPQANRTTSEGQAYALLRALWLNDRKAFEGVLAWTQDHMGYRYGDKLFSWLWEGDKLIDTATASDADVDMASALILAGKRWENNQYAEIGKQIAGDIWSKEVVEINGQYVLVAGSDMKRDDFFIVNPSYFSPGAYKVFAQVDPGHDWNKLADDTYSLLNQIKSKYFLPPNWFLINGTTGEISDATSYYGDSAELYGFDAFRLFWRIALDYDWYSDSRAKDYLVSYERFFESEWQKNKDFKSIYTKDGVGQVGYSSLSTSSAPLSIFYVTNRKLADEVYRELYVNSLKYEEGYWGDGKNYFEQNWAWFGVGLYSGNLQNY